MKRATQCSSRKSPSSGREECSVTIKTVTIGFVAIVFAFSIAASAQSPSSGPAKKTATRVMISHPEVPRIPATELARLIKSKAKVIIIDTQDPDGFQMWHIPTAINIPYSPTADPTDRQLKLMELPAGTPIVIYCLCEEGTDSAKMALEMRQLGYRTDQIRVLEGGLVLWDEKGFPMVKQKLP